MESSTLPRLECAPKVGLHRYQPQYHIISPAQPGANGTRWPEGLNDANAVFERNGVFHILHQCDGGPPGLPCGGGWEGRGQSRPGLAPYYHSWGHVVSLDGARWRRVKDAIAPAADGSDGQHGSACDGTLSFPEGAAPALIYGPGCDFAGDATTGGRAPPPVTAMSRPANASDLMLVDWLPPVKLRFQAGSPACSFNGSPGHVWRSRATDGGWQWNLVCVPGDTRLRSAPWARYATRDPTLESGWWVADRNFSGAANVIGRAGGPMFLTLGVRTASGLPAAARPLSPPPLSPPPLSPPPLSPSFWRVDPTAMDPATMDPAAMDPAAMDPAAMVPVLARSASSPDASTADDPNEPAPVASPTHILSQSLPAAIHGGGFAVGSYSSRTMRFSRTGTFVSDYGAVGFSAAGLAQSSGRTLFIGWVRAGSPPANSTAGCPRVGGIAICGVQILSLPRVLTWEASVRMLVAKPLQELDQLHNATLCNVSGVLLPPTGMPYALPVPAGRGLAIDVQLEIELPATELPAIPATDVAEAESHSPKPSPKPLPLPAGIALTLSVFTPRNRDGDGAAPTQQPTHQVIRVSDPDAHGSRQVTCCGGASFSMAAAERGRLKVRALVDRSVVEWFVGDGRAVQTQRAYPEEGDDGVQLAVSPDAPGGAVLIRRAVVYEMGCGWV